MDLRLERIPRTLTACAHGWIGGGKNARFRLGCLLDLCQGIDNTADESNRNGRDTGEGHGGIEEYEPAERNG